jgi:hypothetical protein
MGLAKYQQFLGQYLTDSCYLSVKKSHFLFINLSALKRHFTDDKDEKLTKVVKFIKSCHN